MTANANSGSIGNSNTQGLPNPVLLTLREPLLNEEAAATVLNLSPATLKKWRRTRRGPRYYRLGSAVRYKREDLEAFVSESAEHPCSPRHNEKGDR